MRIGGKLCPEFEFAPTTPEGFAVSAILDRLAIWKFVGEKALISGLDLNEALASVPPELDRDFTRRLLLVAESHFVATNNEARTEQDATP